MVTADPIGPAEGDKLVSGGATVTEDGSALLASPPTVTTTLPLVAPAGTGTTMLFADHVVGVAAVPLNVTVLVPIAAPKLLPVMTAALGIGPLGGERLVRLGATGAS